PVFPEFALHFHRHHPPDEPVLFSFLDRSGSYTGLRVDGPGGGVRVVVSDAVDRGADFWAADELAVRRGGYGLEQLWRLSWTLFAAQQLGRRGAAGENLSWAWCLGGERVCESDVRGVSVDVRRVFVSCVRDVVRFNPFVSGAIDR